MIQLFNVAKSFRVGPRETVILRDASIELPSDKRILVLGSKDSGKTTLIRLLAGMSLPDDGTITRLARLSFPLGFLGSPNSKQTVREQIKYAAELYGADPKEVLDYLSCFNEIYTMMNISMNQLHPQMRSCVGYALGYAIPFDTYLIDNFIGIGSPQFRAQCEAMYRARTENAGAILTSRQLRLDTSLVDFAMIIHDGALHVHNEVDEAIVHFKRLNDEGSM